MRRCIQCMTPLKEIIHVYNIFKPPTPFCERCEQLWNNIRITHLDERCSRCLNIKTSDSNDCLDCQFLEKEFKLMDQLYCQYRYQGVMKDVLQQYKFMRDYELSNVLSEKLQLPQTDYDYIVPIPSPFQRDVERTFNPVATVLDKMGVDYVNILGTNIRPKQSELGKLERSNAPNPFYVKEEDIDIRDKVILLLSLIHI